MTPASTLPDYETVTLERDGGVLLIGLDRAAKRNAFTMQMLGDLARACAFLEEDPDLRAGVLFAHGAHFTAGLDMLDVAPAITAGIDPYPHDGLDPWRLDGRARTTPLIAVAQGWCLTLGIELLLACDIRISSRDARFAQLEVRRGIFPFGGATLRFPREVGWGNAMRWLVTGDEFDAAEAHRMGLIQHVTPDQPTAVALAREIAQTIARDAAPLGVRETMISAHRARFSGDAAAIEQLRPALREMFGTQDAAEGLQSFIERRPARFTGR